MRTCLFTQSCFRVFSLFSAHFYPPPPPHYIIMVKGPLNHSLPSFSVQVSRVREAGISRSRGEAHLHRVPTRDCKDSVRPFLPIEVLVKHLCMTGTIAYVLTGVTVNSIAWKFDCSDKFTRKYNHRAILLLGNTVALRKYYHMYAISRPYPNVVHKK